MFFLKDLPSRQMVRSYAGAYSVDPDTVSDGLAIMRRASLMLRRIESYFTQEDFSQLRFLFLIVIDREPERDNLTVGEITDRLDVAGPVVTRTLRVLIEDGMVTTAKDEKDSRTKHVTLTVAGREKLEALLPGYFAIIENEMTRAL